MKLNILLVTTSTYHSKSEKSSSNQEYIETSLHLSEDTLSFPMEASIEFVKHSSWEDESKPPIKESTH